MNDMAGLEEFGGVARWRNVMLHFPDGHIESHRLVAIDGQLPNELKRPLNGARTAYERFTLCTIVGGGDVYRWVDFEER